MRKGTHHQNAQGVIGLLIVAIAFVLFYKFVVNQDAFMNDSDSLRNYLLLAVVSMGLLLGLFYLASKPHVAVKKKKK